MCHRKFKSVENWSTGLIIILIVCLKNNFVCYLADNNIEGNMGNMSSNSTMNHSLEL